MIVEKRLSFRWKITHEVPVEVKLAVVDRGPITRTVEAPGKVDLRLRKTQDLGRRALLHGDPPRLARWISA